MADVLDADAGELLTLWLASKVYEIIEGDERGIDASKIAIEEFVTRPKIQTIWK